MTLAPCEEFRSNHTGDRRIMKAMTSNGGEAISINHGATAAGFRVSLAKRDGRWVNMR